jgi:hypothetical protein
VRLGRLVGTAAPRSRRSGGDALPKVADPGPPVPKVADPGSPLPEVSATSRALDHVRALPSDHTPSPCCEIVQT